MLNKELINILETFNPDLEIEIEVKDELWSTDDVEINEVFYNHPENKRLNINLTPPPEEEEEEEEVTFESALEEFVETSQNIVDENMKQFPGQWKRLELMRGRRYIRIVAWDGVQRSAWAFIDTTNGDILRPASWKTPAKHARGNIFDEKYTVTPWGPPYLK